MILLDTNILSALMQRVPDPAVVAWLDTQAPETVWTTSVTLFEARYGLALLPDGQRRVRLQQELEQLVQVEFGHRVLAFDARAAQQAALLSARRKAQGRNVDMRDTFIAGIALAHGATLATRNTRHFDDLSVPVVNPWPAP
jgi:predicted nucleic acid-binding protein